MRENMKYNVRQHQLRKWQLERMLEICMQTESAKHNGVVFFGDSITQFYDIQKYYPELSLKYNCGILGATAQELLWMVDEAVIKYQPKLVVLMIGTNDLGTTTMTSPKEIAAHVKEIIEMIIQNCPNTKVLLLSTLPCVESISGYYAQGKDCDTELGMRCNDLIAMIYQQYQEIIWYPQVIFYDVFSHFVNKKREVKQKYYKDGLHLNAEGYQHFTNIIKEKILTLMNDT